MIERERERWPERELTRAELQHYLLGDPRIRDDTGLAGRMAQSLSALERKVDRLYRLLWAVLLALVAALLALVADLVLALQHHA